jgi:hypothetical protein
LLCLSYRPFRGRRFRSRIHEEIVIQADRNSGAFGRFLDLPVGDQDVQIAGADARKTENDIALLFTIEVGTDRASDSGTFGRLLDIPGVNQDIQVVGPDIPGTYDRGTLLSPVGVAPAIVRIAPAGGPAELDPVVVEEGGGLDAVGFGFGRRGRKDLYSRRGMCEYGIGIRRYRFRSDSRGGIVDCLPLSHRGYREYPNPNHHHQDLSHRGSPVSAAQPHFSTLRAADHELQVSVYPV